MGMKKSKVCTMRLSEELLSIIDQQVGDNFTQKFERLVYNCYMLATAKNEEIRRLDEEIALRRDQLSGYRKELSQLLPLCSSIKRQLTSIDNYLEDYIEDRL